MFRRAVGWAVLLYSLVRAFTPRARTPWSRVQTLQEARGLPRLDLPYYAARGSSGWVFLPKDRYLEEVETLLREIDGYRP